MGKRPLLALISLALLSLGFQNCTSQSGVTTPAPALQSAVTSAAGSTVESGHEHGNGGDDLQYSKVAWFAQSTREVNYCLQVDLDFPLSSAQAARAVDAALTTWSGFIAANGRSLYSTSVIAKRYKAIADCAAADLTLHFGGAKPATSNSKLGSSLRTSFDTKANWGAGRIWISAAAFNVKDGFRFQGALLHLLGEMMGFGPVEGTIMDPAWEAWLTAAATPALQAKLSSIENDRRLSGTMGVVAGSVALTPALKARLGLAVTGDSVSANIDFDTLTLKLQDTTLRFRQLYTQKLRRGYAHRAVYFNTQAPYGFMRTVPIFLAEDDAESVNVLQFTELPGRPQVVLELNGETAISLHELE